MACLLAFLIIVTVLETTNAETVEIRASKTSSTRLDEVMTATIRRLSKAQGNDHKIILSGHFRPAHSVRVNWFSQGSLTISTQESGARIDGSLIADRQETLFLAGQNVTLENVHFTNSKGHSVVVGGNSNNYKISDCRFEDCSKSAIHVWNDPYTIVRDSTETRGWIVRNRIERFNLEDAKWANDGICVYDQRVLIADNIVSNSATETNGIRAMGRDLTIERNRIAQVSRDDSGGIYLWGGQHAAMFRGNVVRWNHIIGASRGIYLDDGTSGAEVFENVIQNSSVCAIFVSGGRDNEIRRNVVEQCPVFFHLDSRCLGWDSRPDFKKLVEQSIQRLRSTLANKDDAKFFRRHYKELVEINLSDLTLEKFGRPQNNRVDENFARGVDSTWEFMDFAKEISTDFRKINALTAPTIIEDSLLLSDASFQKRFGFQGFDRLSQMPERTDSK